MRIHSAARIESEVATSCDESLVSVAVRVRDAMRSWTSLYFGLQSCLLRSALMPIPWRLHRASPKHRSEVPIDHRQTDPSRIGSPGWMRQRSVPHRLSRLRHPERVDRSRLQTNIVHIAGDRHDSKFATSVALAFIVDIGAFFAAQVEHPYRIRRVLYQTMSLTHRAALWPDLAFAISTDHIKNLRECRHAHRHWLLRRRSIAPRAM